MNKTAQATESLKQIPRRLGLRRFSAVELLITLALLFTCVHFVEEIKGGDLILSVLLSVVMLSAVAAVEPRRHYAARRITYLSRDEILRTESSKPCSRKNR